MRETVLRIGLAVLAVPSVVIGIWAAFTPRSFYDDFPGLRPHVGRGRRARTTSTWSATSVSSTSLSLIIIVVRDLVTLPVLVRAVLAGWLVYGVPHLVYHLRHMQPLRRQRSGGSWASLAFVPILAVALLVIEVRATRTEEQIATG